MLIVQTFIDNIKFYQKPVLVFIKRRNGLFYASSDSIKKLIFKYPQIRLMELFEEDEIFLRKYFKINGLDTDNDLPTFIGINREGKLLAWSQSDLESILDTLLQSNTSWVKACLLFIQFLGKFLLILCTKWIAFAPLKLQNERLSVCGSCPFAYQGKCLECKCILTQKVKYKASSCPFKYW